LKKVLVSRYKCPCCDYYTYPVPTKEAVGFICPVCFWENDVFISSENEPSDCNHGLTILEGRSNYKKYGACEETMISNVRSPKECEITGTEQQEL
jgi:hypothetical protein